MYLKFYPTLLLALSLTVVVFPGCSSQTDPPKIAAVEDSASRRQDSQLAPLELPPKALQIGNYVAGSVQRGNDPKFVELAPGDTGVDLQHVWDPPAEHRNLVNPIFGAGVAIGDYDNDGLQDIYVARSTDAGRLFRNLGEMKFEDVTRKVGIDPDGMWASATTFIDINNDGRLDLYICGFDCHNRLYINQGEKFIERAEEYGLNYKGSSVEMAFADYDCDGDLDAYLVTNHMKPSDPSIPLKIIRRRGEAPQVNTEYQENFYFIKYREGYRRVRGGQYDYLFRNDNGKFVDVTDEVGIGKLPYLGLSANWWDYNEDGWPDLYVANDFMGPDLLYRNNGPNPDGGFTFTDVTSDALPHTPWFSMGSDFGDINNDGRIDYFASDMAGTNHYRDKLSMGNMSGPDSNAWFLNTPDPPQYMRNALYLNTGAERFMEVAYLTSLAKTDWTWTVRLADFDNDGWQDIFFTNGMTRDLLNGDLLAELKQLQDEHASSGDTTKTRIEIAQEFWEQQQPFQLENLAFQNTGDLKFKNVSKKWGLDHLGVSTGAAVGDLDNDGDLDLVVNGFEEPVRIYRNDVAKQNSIRIRLVGVSSNRYGVGTTVRLFNGNGQEQVRHVSASRGFMSASESIVHFGIGDNSQVEKLVIEWPSGIVQQFDKLAANQLYTVLEQGSADSNIQTPVKPMFAASNLLQEFNHQELEFDDFQYQPLLPNKYSQLGPGMSVGDVDGDGDEDLFIGGAAFTNGRLLLNENNRFRLSKQSAFSDDAKFEDMGSLFFDVDLDGDLDLYVVSGGVEFEAGDEHYQDRLYLNDGQGEFTRSSDLPEIRHSGSCVAASDFDQDGDIDLFVGGRIVPRDWPQAATSLMLKNTDGRFEVATQDVVPDAESAGMVTSAVWSDVNNDGWSDLLVTYEFGPIRYFENRNGKLSDQTDQAGLGSDIGWFNSICSGDIDNDGDTDYFVGNFGLNTKYKVDRNHSALLYYGDFEGNGRKRIVEAKFEGDTCLPRRGLSCSSHAMPMVKEKTPTFHEFAVSDLVEIYTDEKIETATKYEANNLQSMVLINHSNPTESRFELKPLPRIAQASPVFGCCFNDVDGDGNLDLFLAQNFYGPQRETGYMDGGIGMLLLGDGQGNFQPIDAEDSGIVISEDATSLVAMDINDDGKVDFVVGKNNQAPLVFLNQTESKLNSVNQNEYVSASVEQGGKPPLVLPGRKIMLDVGNGKQRLHEITMGGGYLSQGTSRLFIKSD